ncbi:hypothetical protein HJFPF1_09838 [Paramyrothecium foliicola]|nr:hypothetical protein HJFPF1_09838 [Paramyrothecium foliicola]
MLRRLNNCVWALLPQYHTSENHETRAWPSSNSPSFESLLQELLHSDEMSFTRDEIQREALFDAFEKGTGCDVISVPINDANGLGKWELHRCFEILHACGTTTDPEATRKTTRQSINGFLDAIFRGWTSSSEEELAKPSLELPVEVEVEVGRICRDPLWHTNLDACVTAGLCTSSVKAKARLSASPAILTVQFFCEGDHSNDSMSLLMRNDVRWSTNDWAEDLKQSLQAKIFGKVRKYNKLLAIWHTRRIIKDWAQGLLTEPDVMMMDFMDPKVADNALRILGVSPHFQNLGGSQS